MKEIKIKREFLKVLLDDEIELWNLANNRSNNKLMGIYQKNIDQIKELLKLKEGQCHYTPNTDQKH